MELNLNQSVRVKLTDYGRQLHAADHVAFWSGKGRPPPYSYMPPREDHDGWSTWQLWSLMQAFGQHIHLGMQNPFDLTMQIVEDRRATAPASESPMDVVRALCK